MIRWPVNVGPLFGTHSKTIIVIFGVRWGNMSHPCHPSAILYTIIANRFRRLNSRWRNLIVFESEFVFESVLSHFILYWVEGDQTDVLHAKVFPSLVVSKMKCTSGFVEVISINPDDSEGRGRILVSYRFREGGDNCRKYRHVQTHARGFVLTVVR